MCFSLLTRLEERLDLAGHRPVYHVGGEYLVFCLLESTLVLLPIDPRGQRFALLVQELRAYAPTLGGGHLVLLPALAAASPLLEEHAPLAVWCGEHHQGTTGHREHRTHGEVEFIVHTRCLVHYQERRPAKPSDGLLGARQRDYTAIVLQLKTELAFGLWCHGP